jgi:hypothetical protein
VQRNKLNVLILTLFKKKCDVFAIVDILARHGKVGQKNQ